MGQDGDTQQTLQGTRAIKYLTPILKGSTLPLFDNPLKLDIPTPPNGPLGWDTCLITGRQDTIITAAAPPALSPAPVAINIYLDFYEKGHVCASLVQAQYIRGPISIIGGGNADYTFYVQYHPTFIQALKFARQVWIWTSINATTTDKLATIGLNLQFSQLPLNLPNGFMIATPTII